MLIAFLYKLTVLAIISFGFCNVILGIFYPQSFKIKKKQMERLFTFAVVYFFVWFANFCL